MHYVIVKNVYDSWCNKKWYIRTPISEWYIFHSHLDKLERKHIRLSMQVFKIAPEYRIYFETVAMACSSFGAITAKLIITEPTGDRSTTVQVCTRLYETKGNLLFGTNSMVLATSYIHNHHPSSSLLDPMFQTSYRCTATDIININTHNKNQLYIHSYIFSNVFNTQFSFIFK